MQTGSDLGYEQMLEIFWKYVTAGVVIEGVAMKAA